jgi:hypothetical protein
VGVGVGMGVRENHNLLLYFENIVGQHFGSKQIESERLQAYLFSSRFKLRGNEEQFGTFTYD